MASGGYDSNGKTGTERPPTEVLFSPQKNDSLAQGLWTKRGLGVFLELQKLVGQF